jgi:hypothetical protein
MTAQISSYQEVLKEVEGELHSAVVDNLWFIEYFEKRSKFTEGGKYMREPVHVGRNTGVGFRGAGITLPDSGAQSFLEMQVSPAYSYGSFSFDGPLLSAAPGEGMSAFIDAADFEMDRLKIDVRDAEAQAAVTGGEYKGILNQRKDMTASTGAGAANVGTDILEYSGDTAPFLAAGQVSGQTPAANGSATWVPVTLYRMDSYEEVEFISGNGNSDAELYIGGFDTSRSNPTVTLVSFEGTGGNVQITTQNHTGEALTAVRLNAAQGTVGVDPARVGGTHEAGKGVLVEPTGIVGNLCDPTHFTLDRSDTTGGLGALLQSYVIGHDTTAAGTDGGDREALAFSRLNFCFDLLEDEQGSDALPDLAVCKSYMKGAYVAVTAHAAGTSFTQEVGGKGSMELGGKRKTATINGVSFVTDGKALPGCIKFMSSKWWVYAERLKGKFADLDGNILRQIANSDSWGGFYKHYYNHFCRAPQKQLILGGISTTY